MSEGAPEPTGTEGPGTGTPEGGKPEGGDDEAQRLLAEMASQDPAELARQVAHWKSMARKNEQRSKEALKKASEWDKLQDSQKTEVQRAIEAQQAAEAERDKAIARHNRVIAAATNDLPVDMIDYLGDGTEEEIMERAEQFSQVIEARAQQIAEQMLAGRNGQQPGTGSTRPVESLRPGSAPASGGTPQTPDDWFRQLIQGR